MVNILINICGSKLMIKNVKNRFPVNEVSKNAFLAVDFIPSCPYNSAK